MLFLHNALQVLQRFPDHLFCPSASPHYFEELAENPKRQFRFEFITEFSICFYGFQGIICKHVKCSIESLFPCMIRDLLVFQTLCDFKTTVSIPLFLRYLLSDCTHSILVFRDVHLCSVFHSLSKRFIQFWKPIKS